MKLISKTIAVALTLGVGATFGTSAQTDFNAIVGQVLARNPQLAADSLTARADLLSMAAEGNLPDPEIGFDYKWGNTAEAGNRWGLEVSQGFDWPGAYSAHHRAVKAAEEAEELAARGRVRALALETRLKLIDIIEVNLRVKTLTQVAANMDSLLQLTRRQFESGNATILTLKKTEFERYSTLSSLDEALSEQDRLRADLAAMAGGQLIDTDGLTEFPEMTLLSEDQYLKSSVPEIEALEASGRAEALSARAARLKRLPGFSVGYVHEYEEGMHFNGFSLGLTLPLLSTRHTAAAATARAEAATRAIEAARLTRAATVRADHAEATRLKKRIENYHTVFGSNDYLHLLKRAFDSGQLSAHEYLSEINEYLALFLDHLRIEKNYRQTLETLNSLR